jgi:hypothetical protein
MGFKTNAEQMAKQARRTLAAAGMGALVALGAAVAPAQAAVVVGAFDPAFGPFLPNLGYRGQATFFVPDACFAFTGTVANSAGCSGGAMAVQAISLELYNLTTPGQPSIYTNITTAIPTFVFDVLIGFDVATNRNEVKGVNTNFSQGFGVTLNDGLGVNFSNITMYLSFSSSASAASGSGANLLACQEVRQFDCTPSRAVPGNPATTVFGTRDGGPPGVVPEPSAAWLSLVALGAAAVASRRRKGQAQG